MMACTSEGQRWIVNEETQSTSLCQLVVVRPYTVTKLWASEDENRNSSFPIKFSGAEMKSCMQSYFKSCVKH